MINVLVVEDEPPILRGICNKIRKTNCIFNIMHTAYNGEEAIGYLTSCTIDVVFTDINMPIVTGLELLEHINSKFPHIITVILSGYQDFEYAQKAVKLGAYDYLLKPLENHTLQLLLDKISHQLSIKKNTTIQRSLMDTIYGNFSSNLSTLFSHESSFYIVGFCFGSFPVRGSTSKDSILKYLETINFDTLITDVFSDQKNFWIIPGKTSSEKILIFNNISDIRLLNGINKVYKILDNSKIPMTAIMGKQIEDIKTIKICYEYLRHQLYRNIIFGHSQIIDLSIHKKNDEYLFSPSEEKKLSYILEQDLFSLLKDELLKLMYKLLELKLTQVNLESILKNIILLCKKTKFINCNLSDIEFEMLEALSNCYTYESLCDHMIDILLDYHSQTRVAPSHDKIYLVEQIELFIQAHFAENLINQMLSAHFGLVPTYISMLFKTYKGMSPSDYILTLKMNKAKEMLQNDPLLLVKDIAQIVGYSDALYFSRVFKKETGMYPSEYRKNG